MLKMAWRNLWRNGTRTMITATAIALAYSLYLIANGVQDWTFTEMRVAAAKAAGGDVLVQPVGLNDVQTNDRLIDDGDALLGTIRDDARVRLATGRIVLNGLLSTSASSAPVVLHGVDPRTEVQFHDVRKYLAAGTWFESDRDDPIVLGKTIADELDAEIGDRVILTVNDRDGEMRRALFHLTGVLATGTRASDHGMVFTTVAAARESVGLDDEFSQIGVLSDEHREEVANALSEKLASDDLESLPWDVAMPDLVGFIEMKKSGGAFFGLLLFIVVLFAITNTFLMVVMERVREFGLIGALGLKPRQIATVLLLETALLALVAMFIGLTIGLAAHGLIAHYGIDVGALYGDQGLDVAGVQLNETVIRSEVIPLRWLQTSASVFFMVLIAAMYPAWKAARLAPAEAMRFYE